MEKVLSVLHKLSLYLTEQNEKLQCHGFVTESMEISFENLIDEINHLCGTKKRSRKSALPKKLNHKDWQISYLNEDGNDSKPDQFMNYLLSESSESDSFEDNTGIQVVKFNRDSLKHSNQETCFPEKKKTRKSKDFDDITFGSKRRSSENQEHKRFKCDKCPNTFSSPAILKRHVNDIHLGLRPFVCNQCGKRYKRKAHLQEHLMTHYAKEHKRVNCQTCFKSFSSEKNLREHQRIFHNDPNKFYCCICNIYYNKAKLFNDHNKKYHDKAITKYHCDECSITFKTEELLAKHRLTHDNEADFVCTLCLLGFTNEEEFREHVKDHKEKEND